MFQDNNSFEARLAAINAQFSAKLPGRIQVISSHWKNWLLNTTQSQHFEKLVFEIHTLRGTAGSFKRADISAICLQLEELLNKERHTPGKHKDEITLLLEKLQSSIHSSE